MTNASMDGKLKKKSILVWRELSTKLPTLSPYLKIGVFPGVDEGSFFPAYVVFADDIRSLLPRPFRHLFFLHLSLGDESGGVEKGRRQ